MARFTTGERAEAGIMAGTVPIYDSKTGGEGWVALAAGAHAENLVRLLNDVADSDATPASKDRVISIVKLSDDRYGVQNECDVSDLTAGNEDEMANVLILWFDLRRRSRI